MYPNTRSSRSEMGAMKRALLKIQVRPFQIRYLQRNDMCKSFRALAVCCDRHVTGWKPEGVTFRSWDSVCTLVAYMRIPGICGILLPPGTLELDGVKFAVVDMDRYKLFSDRLSPMNDSLLALLRSMDISLGDAYKLHLRFGIHDYDTLVSARPQLEHANFHEVGRNTVVELVQVIDVIANAPHNDRMDDPMADFDYTAFLKRKMDDFLSRFNFDQQEMDHVDEALDKMNVVSLLRAKDDFFNARGNLANVRPSQLYHICNAIRVFDRMRALVPTERMGRFEFDVYFANINTAGINGVAVYTAAQYDANSHFAINNYFANLTNPVPPNPPAFGNYWVEST